MNGTLKDNITVILLAEKGTLGQTTWYWIPSYISQLSISVADEPTEEELAAAAEKIQTLLAQPHENLFLDPQRICLGGFRIDQWWFRGGWGLVAFISLSRNSMSHGLQPSSKDYTNQTLVNSDPHFFSGTLQFKIRMSLHEWKKVDKDLWPGVIHPSYWGSIRLRHPRMRGKSKPENPMHIIGW